MAIKMLVSDYDRTFYLNDLDIEKNILAVKHYRDKKNIFVIATGRSFYDFKKKAEKYNIEYDYLLINHGATILDNKDNIITSFSMNNDIVKQVIDDLDIEDTIEFFCCNLDNSRCNKDDKDLTKIHVKYSSLSKAIAVCEHINNKYSDFVVCYNLFNGMLEIISNKINKSIAIEVLIKLYNIDEKNVYTIGDGNSDIDMIKDFKGYCVENSVDELLKICKNKTVKSVSDLIEKIG